MSKRPKTRNSQNPISSSWSKRSAGYPAFRWRRRSTKARSTSASSSISRSSRSPAPTSTTGPCLEKVASTRRPVIVSSGGASEKDLDDIVSFFGKRDIPLAINHCVSLYPSEDSELDLDQIDFLHARYPDHVIGLSTHEHRDWHSSMLISYAKGARSWERHVDVSSDGAAVSPYCSLPEQCDVWFKAFKKAREMCGGVGASRRVISQRETDYLNALVRGVFARRDLEPGYVFSKEGFERDFFLAIPLQKGQLSCREVMNGERLVAPIKARDPLTIDHIDGPYHESQALRELIMNRGDLGRDRRRRDKGRTSPSARTRCKAQRVCARRRLLGTNCNLNFKQQVSRKWRGGRNDLSTARAR